MQMGFLRFWQNCYPPTIPFWSLRLSLPHPFSPRWSQGLVVLPTLAVWWDGSRCFPAPYAA